MLIFSDETDDEGVSYHTLRRRASDGVGQESDTQIGHDTYGFVCSMGGHLEEAFLLGEDLDFNLAKIKTAIFPLFFFSSICAFGKNLFLFCFW